jgi:hypothetical protein
LGPAFIAAEGPDLTSHGVNKRDGMGGRRQTKHTRDVAVRLRARPMFELRDGLRHRARDACSLFVGQTVVGPVEDAPSQRCVAGFVARDARHRCANAGIACVLGLPCGDESAERLTHTSFDGVLDGDVRQRTYWQALGTWLLRGYAIRTGEASHLACVPHLVRCRTMGRACER